MGQMLVPMILMAAGTAVQVAAQRKAQSAMNKAVETELERQKEYQREGTRKYEASFAESGPEKYVEQAGEGAKERLLNYETLRSVPSAAVTSPASRFIPTDTTRSMINQSNLARSVLGGQQDWWSGQQRKDVRAATDLGLTSGFSRASQALLPMEIESASHKGDSLKTAGMVLSTMGMLSGMSGALRAPSVAGQTASVSPAYSYTNMFNPLYGMYSMMAPKR